MKKNSLEDCPAPAKLSPAEIQTICNEFGVHTDGEGNTAQHFVIDRNGIRTFVPVWKDIPVKDGTVQMPVRERIMALLSEN